MALALVILVVAPATLPARSASDLQLSTSLQDGRPGAARGTAGAVAPAPSAYRLDSGDDLAITVFGEPDLSLESIRVTPDGTGVD